MHKLVILEIEQFPDLVWARNKFFKPIFEQFVWGFKLKQSVSNLPN